MTNHSINAYELLERVKSYDTDMELMHPNRAKMVDIALELLAGDERTVPPRALDIGAGTGYFTQRFLEQFPGASVVAVDGSASMLDMARARLGELASRVEFVTGDFRNLAALVAAVPPFDVVFSSYALHHLDRGEKTDVIGQARALLQPGGWFLNADICRSDVDFFEDRIQTLRVAGIVGRNKGRDPRFGDAASTRQHLDRVEEIDGDQPLPLTEDLQVLVAAGLRHSDVFWMEYREAVSGGIR